LVEWRLAGEPKYSEKICPSATLSTTNPTWLDPVLNPGRRGGKPATNRLSFGAAYKYTLRKAVNGTVSMYSKTVLHIVLYFRIFVVILYKYEFSAVFISVDTTFL
jgi:hypothetical protein